MNTALNYTIRGDVHGGSYQNYIEVKVNNCAVTDLKGPVSVRRTTYLTPNRLEIMFNYSTEISISFEMARALRDTLSTMNLDDDEPEETE